MPVTLLTQEAEIRKIVVPNQPGQIVCDTLSKKNPNTKKGLEEWLKVEALSSSPSTAKKKKKIILRISLLHILHASPFYYLIFPV
jgi:hypothetical protein